MEQTASRNHWKDIAIAAVALALLGLLVWVYLRPWEPERHIIFGDLGRRVLPTNAIAGGPIQSLQVPPANVVSNIPFTNSQNARRIEPAPMGQGSVAGDAGSNMASAVPSRSPAMENDRPLSPLSSASQTPIAPSNPVPQPAPITPQPPARSSSARTTHHIWVPEGDTWTDPAHKDSTASLLAQAQAADMARVHPIPAPTADLLRNDSEPWRWFDTEAGSNVVFILDNSLNMLTNGRSLSARQELARTLQSMNAGKLFYVLFFHSGGYENMPSLGPLPASPENIRAMTNWLFSVGHRSGTDPTKAMQRALGLAPAPDTVWLLSGSELPDNVVDNIRAANASVNARINTAGLYTRDGEEALRQIANENRGVYRFIPPPNAAPP